MLVPKLPSWSPNLIYSICKTARYTLDGYCIRSIDGYLPFDGALEYILNQMHSSQLWHPWLPYLFVFRPDFLRNAVPKAGLRQRERAVVGLGGFKSVPDAHRLIEIGYSVAPTYQGKGFATSEYHPRLA
jgi:[ribosomal protein S5]-alanine N-acetyltransferase